RERKDARTVPPWLRGGISRRRRKHCLLFAPRQGVQSRCCLEQPDRSAYRSSANMFRLSAFADEISPDPQEQVDLLDRCGVRHIELRSIHQTNVLDLTDLQVSELKSLLDRRGFRLSAIGSPIGKTKIDQPFEATRKSLERAIELCKVFDTPNIRIFSYYLADGTSWP